MVDAWSCNLCLRLMYAGSQTRGGSLGERMPTDFVYHLDAEEPCDGRRPPDR